MRNQLFKPSRLAVAITLSLGVAAPFVASAQEEGSGIEEVMVTATRRAETNIQSTPVAVTAISGEDLEMAVPRNLGDVAAFVPNFSAAQVTGFNAASFAIRGIGQTDIIVYLDAPVGVIVDDFVMPSIQTQLLDPFDIESVEVLRGPQGTLFGKNTTGGTVNVKTKDPDVTQGSVDVAGQIARYGEYQAKFAVNVPLIEDEFAIRFSGNFIESDGYYRNGAEFGPVSPFIPIDGITGLTGQGDGADAGGQDVFSGRFKARWEPSDNFTAQFTYEIVRDDSDTPPTVNLTPQNDPRFVFNLLGYTQDDGDPLNVAGVTNRDELLLNMTQGHRIDVDGFYLNLDWDINPNYTLSSITGYREQESRLPNTYPGEIGPISLFDATRDDNRETFQQEIRIASDFDGPWNFVAGGFYQTNDTEFCVLQVLGFLDLLGLGEADFGDPLFFNNNPQILCNAQDATAKAVFGDVTWEVNDRFTVGLGLRYTDE
ncbi:MAG: TonB-dependent receptor, partial [Pseudomonadota bacterium]